MSTINYAKTMEIYVQECIRQIMAGRKEEDILQDASKALGDYLNEEDKKKFLAKMMARAKVRLMLTKVRQDDIESINSNVTNMLLNEGRRGKGAN